MIQSNFFILTVELVLLNGQLGTKRMMLICVLVNISYKQFSCLKVQSR